MFVAKVEDIELKMWSKVEMPEAKRDSAGKLVKDEKGKIVNTGNMLEYTEYIFRDLVGVSFKIMSAKNDFRQYENKVGTLLVKLDRREFQGKTDSKIILEQFIPKKV